ncbi:hypothetical protein JOC86_003147 [Bacillus pakistanensis]|uniref:Anti-sigma factor RsgI-like middle domain-containing protein n=1 Tax=Rossellomorea pakistanensis TaxID=992288 RepID=A0ABS2NFG6_9BACI|nr:hypothetical protein [Bacillus pakistanensis]
MIGEETIFFPMTGTREKRKGIKKYLLLPVVAVAALMLCLSLMLSLFQNDEVYAYVSVDINPSLEMSINRDHEVIDIIPYNLDGKKILSQLKHWKGNTVTEVTSEIILKSKENGYLLNQKIMITSIFTEKINKKQKEAFDHLLNNFALKNKYHKQITVEHSTEEIRKKAHKNGVSIRSYIDEKLEPQNSEQPNKNIKMKDESQKDREKNIPANPNDKKENITDRKQNHESHPSQKKNENRGHSKPKAHPQRTEQKSNGRGMNHPIKEAEETKEARSQNKGKNKERKNNQGKKSDPDHQPNMNENNGAGNKNKE